MVVMFPILIAIHVEIYRVTGSGHAGALCRERAGRQSGIVCVRYPSGDIKENDIGLMVLRCILWPTGKNATWKHATACCLYSTQNVPRFWQLRTSLPSAAASARASHILP